MSNKEIVLTMEEAQALLDVLNEHSTTNHGVYSNENEEIAEWALKIFNKIEEAQPKECEHDWVGCVILDSYPAYATYTCSKCGKGKSEVVP